MDDSEFYRNDSRTFKLGDIVMTSEPNTEDTSVKIEIIPQSGNISAQTSDLVENEMAGESDDVKSETKALIDALKKTCSIRGSKCRYTHPRDLSQRSA